MTMQPGKGMDKLFEVFSSSNDFKPTNFGTPRVPKLPGVNMRRNSIPANKKPAVLYRKPESLSTVKNEPRKEGIDKKARTQSSEKKTI